MANVDITALANAKTEAEVDAAAKQLNEAIKKNEKKDDNSTKRLEFLDELRGFCLLAMVLFHGCYLLGEYFGWAYGTQVYNFLAPLQPVFASVFIIVSGFCVRFSKDLKKSALKLLVFALLLSVVTITLQEGAGMRKTAVWFGILHLLGLSKMIWFAGKKLFEKKWFPPVGLVLCLVLYIYTAHVAEGYFDFFGFLHLKLPDFLYQSDFFCFLGCRTPTFEAWDYAPLLPHFFLFLFGACLGSLKTAKKEYPAFCYKRFIHPFGWMGKHSLAIYMLHMPVIFGLAYVVKLLAAR